MTRSAREVVELYNLVVWNERDFALAEELTGDTVVRHEVGEANTLIREEAVQRIVDMWEVSLDRSESTSAWIRSTRHGAITDLRWLTS